MRPRKILRILIFVTFAAFIVASPVGASASPASAQSPKELLNQKIKELYARVHTVVQAGISRGRNIIARYRIELWNDQAHALPLQLNDLRKRVRQISSSDGSPSIVMFSYDERVALNKDFDALKAQITALTQKMPAGAKLPMSLDNVKGKTSFIPEYGGHIPLNSPLRR